MVTAATKLKDACSLEEKLWQTGEVAQSDSTLCHHMDCACQAPPSVGLSRQEYWSGLPFPSPGEETGGSNWGIPTQGSKLGLLHCRQILYPLSLQGSHDEPRQHIKKLRHYLDNKGPSSKSCGFSSSHVWIWGLDHKRRLNIKELMLLNCDVGEDSWESLGLQGDQTSQS